MSQLDRYYLKSSPEVIVKVQVPSLVTLWVVPVVDMEDETFESSMVYITINDETKCRLWKGTPLMTNRLHFLHLEAGDSVWACTRDQSLVGIQIDAEN
jgi:hypothetical protein